MRELLLITDLKTNLNALLSKNEFTECTGTPSEREFETTCWFRRNQWKVEIVELLRPKGLPTYLEIHFRIKLVYLDRSEGLFDGTTAGLLNGRSQLQYRVPSADTWVFRAIRLASFQRRILRDVSEAISIPESPQSKALAYLKPFTARHCTVDLRACHQAVPGKGIEMMKLMSYRLGADVIGTDDWYAVKYYGNVYKASPDGTVKLIKQGHAYQGSLLQTLVGPGPKPQLGFSSLTWDQLGAP